MTSRARPRRFARIERSARDGGEAALLARLAAGETGPPMTALYARYAAGVYGIGLRMLGDKGLAEDLVQETFVRVWRIAPRFDPERGSPSTFVFMIARRAAIDLVRRKGVQRLAGAEEPDLERTDVGGDDEYDAVVLGLDLEAAMGSLSPLHREVLELSFSADLSQADIAERLGIPLGTVKSRVFHGLRALHTVMTETA